MTESMLPKTKVPKFSCGDKVQLAERFICTAPVWQRETMPIWGEVQAVHHIVDLKDGEVILYDVWWRNREDRGGRVVHVRSTGWVDVWMCVGRTGCSVSRPSGSRLWRGDVGA